MAFITVSPMSGEGNATLSVTAAKHTGRASRSGSLTITAKNDTTKKATVNVTQVAAGDILEKVDATAATTSKAAIPFSITFKSNAAKFYFGLALSMNTPTATKIFNNALVSDWKYAVNRGAATPITAGAGTQAIEMTEGTDEEYTVVLTGTIPVNTMAMNRYFTAFVSPITVNQGNWDDVESILITTGQLLSQGTASTISVNPTSLASVAAAGATQSVSVSSNDEWTVSVA